MIFKKSRNSKKLVTASSLALVDVDISSQSSEDEWMIKVRRAMSDTELPLYYAYRRKAHKRAKLRPRESTLKPQQSTASAWCMKIDSELSWSSDESSSSRKRVSEESKDDMVRQGKKRALQKIPVASSCLEGLTTKLEDNLQVREDIENVDQLNGFAGVEPDQPPLFS
ncbi:OLC1v1024678C1 [Oldenlandia corymbosa var. corymbosa]|uniref:OLC1v1024678C1 n=1 Tax=Oldenlandia corymbosa var. corymbosa TaxID=529605 RepID=A0AAV1C2Y2_OLDCO|nr:OLC1v1024678C1 [Oldenlandia corymbosa var. corymbosa]